MMAAPDAAKMKLLIDRGANVNARAKTGYSALMVAAQYGESATPALNLLLDHGAEVRVAAGQHAPMFNATPFFLAAYSGNTEILPRLARGQTNAEIGRTLYMSEATVKTHLLRSFGKLGVSDRTAAVTTAIELGMLPAPGSGRTGGLPR